MANFPIDKTYFCRKVRKKLRTPITITGLSSLSALGSDRATILKSYLKGLPLFERRTINKEETWISPIGSDQDKHLESITQENQIYRELDRTVLMAIQAGRQLQLPDGKCSQVGINIGSSRGATEKFEHYHQEYLESGQSSTLSSPTTTLGNISSWVAQDLGLNGPAISHSVTCSTALHAVLNGIAWIQGGMVDAFIAGGSEAPLTPFTVAQMKAMRIYSKLKDDYACQSLHLDKKSNTMVLGEAAGLVLMESGESNVGLATISGYGYASEALDHPASISATGQCFQRSMSMALETAGLNSVDAIVMHAPGTVKGDLAEMEAIRAIFRNKIPHLTTNKYLIGHTLGASGVMSLEMAVLMLQHDKIIQNPFYPLSHSDRSVDSVMINAVGFGGNAVSILLTK